MGKMQIQCNIYALCFATIESPMNATLLKIFSSTRIIGSVIQPAVLLLAKKKVIVLMESVLITFGPCAPSQMMEPELLTPTTLKNLLMVRKLLEPLRKQLRPPQNDSFQTINWINKNQIGNR